ncbi:MAG: hypothetical protein KDA37_11105, partial [Planctomycetales bacterium]|nr:hypothetical protein [Planctomycetales bacterium]
FWGFIPGLVLVRLLGIEAAAFEPVAGCDVAAVVDGDTVELSCPGAPAVRGRLVGYDAPELFTPACVHEHALAIAATQTLRHAIWSAGRIEVVHVADDKFGRLLIGLRLDGAEVTDLMLGAGLARPYDGGTRKGWCQ